MTVWKVVALDLDLRAASGSVGPPLDPHLLLIECCLVLVAVQHSRLRTWCDLCKHFRERHLFLDGLSI